MVFGTEKNRTAIENPICNTNGIAMEIRQRPGVLFMSINGCGLYQMGQDIRHDPARHKTQRDVHSFER